MQRTGPDLKHNLQRRSGLVHAVVMLVQMRAAPPRNPRIRCATLEYEQKIPRQ